MATSLKALEHENRELRQANEILRKASAYFAIAELDRRSKTRSRSSTIIARSMGLSRSALAMVLEPMADHVSILPIATSTYHDHVAKRTDPGKLSAASTTARRSMATGQPQD
jgi:hypothetical protein